MSPKKKVDQDVIQAAGGLVWRQGEKGKEIAVIHRPRYDDWTLPKGKLRKKETWQQAALREILEEIGCIVRVGDFAGCTCYKFGGIPKVVLYWNMSLEQDLGFQASDEVDQLEWLTPGAALERLSYTGEIKLLRDCDEMA